MANRIVTEAELTGLANHIRGKTGGSAPLTWPGGFEQGVDSIPTPQLIDGRIESNGDHTAPAGTAWRSITAAVPNSYAAADEGKVVADDGQGNLGLEAQGSATYNTNGTRDTRRIGSVTVENCYENYVTPADFQAIVKNGNGPRRFPLHSRIQVGQGRYAEVMSYDTDIDLDDPNAHTCTLWMLNGRRKHEFDARQKFVIVTANEGLPNKQYSYKVGNNAWRTVTLRNTIPKNGYIVFTGDDHTNVATYDASGNQIEEDGATAFVVTTHFEDLNGSTILTNGLSAEGYNRALSGGNCYLFSGARAYIAGPKNNWAAYSGTVVIMPNSGSPITMDLPSPYSDWNLPPSYASEAGFQSLLDDSWLAILKRVSVRCANSTASVNQYDLWAIGDPYYDIVSDKLFLPSITELGFGNNGSVSEGTCWQAFASGNAAGRGYYDRIRKADDRNNLLNVATRSPVLTTMHEIYEGTAVNDTVSTYGGNDESLAIVPAFVV